MNTILNHTSQSISTSAKYFVSPAHQLSLTDKKAKNKIANCDLQKYETTVVQKQWHPLCHQLSLTESRFCLSYLLERQTLMQKQILWHFENLSYHFCTFFIFVPGMA